MCIQVLVEIRRGSLGVGGRGDLSVTQHGGTGTEFRPLEEQQQAGNLCAPEFNLLIVNNGAGAIAQYLSYLEPTNM